MTTAAAPFLSVIIATQRRQGPLVVAMRSVMRQIGVDPTTLELVVVDNDAVPSAQDVVQSLAAEAPFPVCYVHESKPGVAFARNAAAAVARGVFLASLDDDEEAPAGWLAALTATQRKWDSDVVFGPVRGRAPAHVRCHRIYLERFFSRVDAHAEGPIHVYYGCGCSLIRRSVLPDPRAPFSEVYNFSGGEDDALFSSLKGRGARFAWSPQGWVWEDPAPERLTLNYALSRTFVYGQGGTNQYLIAKPARRLAAASSVALGAVQALGFGAVGATFWMLRMRDRAFVYDKAMRGLGKVFFGPRFRRQFYGLRAGETVGRSLWKARGQLQIHTPSSGC